MKKFLLLQLPFLLTCVLLILEELPFLLINWYVHTTLCLLLAVLSVVCSGIAIYKCRFVPLSALFFLCGFFILFTRLLLFTFTMGVSMMGG